MKLLLHSTLAAKNTDLIVGDGESLLIDTTFDFKTSQEMLDGMEQFSKNSPIKYLINTHDDPDHFFWK